MTIEEIEKVKATIIEKLKSLDPIKQEIDVLHNRTVLSIINKYAFGAKFYSWHSIKYTDSIVHLVHNDLYDTKYLASGNLISSFGLHYAIDADDDLIEAISNFRNWYALCAVYRPKMKGGHTYNHYENVRSRERTRSKDERKKKRLESREYRYRYKRNIWPKKCT